MGAAAPSRPYAAPSHPFERRGSRVSCFQTAVFLPRRRPSSSLSSATTLVQLILLQDWQRVLIRARLFPNEIAKPCCIKLYGVAWKLLPIHLACALQPPPKVVEALLSPNANLASIPVESRKSNKRIRFQPWKGLKLSSLTKQQSPDDHKELLSTRGFHWDNDDFSMQSLDSDLSHEWNRHHTYQPKGSLISLEESIGDTTSVATRTTVESSRRPLQAFLQQTGAVLQLTETGGLLPIPAFDRSKEDVETIADDFGSTTVESAASLDQSNDKLLEAAREGKTFLPIHIACLYQASPAVLQLLLQSHPMGALSAIVGMLPVHLISAGWSSSLETQPLGFQVPEMNVGTTTTNNNNKTHSKSLLLQIVLQGMPETIVAKSFQHSKTPKEYLEDPATCLSDAQREDCLSMVDDFLDKYLHGDAFVVSCRDELDSHFDQGQEAVELSYHALVPPEIHCLQLSTSGSSDSPTPLPPPCPFYSFLLERNFDAALDLLETDPSLACEWQYGCDESSSLVSIGLAEEEEEPRLWKRLALHLACSMGAAIPLGLIDTLLKVYPQACRMADPHSGSLPLHLACHFGCQLSVVRRLLLNDGYEDLCKAVDEQGRLPLHCAVLAAAPYAVVELLVQQDATSVLCPDRQGKTPLQYAQYAYPTGSPVVALLELVWM